MARLMEYAKQWTGAKSPEVVTSVLATHINVLIYAYSFWCTQPILPFLVTIGTGLSYFMLGMAWNVPILFIGQVTTILQHVMHCAQALVTHFSDDDARARAMGRLSLSYGLGMVAGSSSGGLLSHWFGYTWVAMYAGVVSWVMIPLSLWTIIESRDHAGITEDSTKKPRGQLSEMLRVVQDKRVFSLLLMQLLVGLGLSVQRSSFSQVMRTQFELSASHIGFVMSFAASCSVLVNSFVVPWALKLFKGESKALVVSLALLCSIFGLYSVVSSFYQLLGLLVPLTMGSTTAYTIMGSLMTKAVPPTDTGTSIGLSHATRTFCGVLCPTLAAYLLQGYGFWSLGAFGATTSLFTLVYIKVGGVFAEAEAEAAAKKEA